MRAGTLALMPFVFTALAFAAPKPSALSIIGPATVRLIESKVLMPPGKKLADYDRYYMLKDMPRVGRPHDVVEGRSISRDGYHMDFRKGPTPVPGVPNAFTVPRGGRLPSAADGGCAIVTIFFDLAARELVLIREEGREDEPPEPFVCNGQA